MSAGIGFLQIFKSITYVYHPAKSDYAKISKLILDKINTNLWSILNVNQQRNTENVMDWFGNIEKKPRHSFNSFDIVNLV